MNRWTLSGRVHCISSVKEGHSSEYYSGLRLLNLSYHGNQVKALGLSHANNRYSSHCLVKMFHSPLYKIGVQLSCNCVGGS